MKILAFETSCDETGVAVVENGRRVLSNLLFSQIKLHAPHGGVVPEIAARNHLVKIIPLLDQALKKAQVTKKDINAIATVPGPGLISSLIVGLETAKALSFAWQKPLLAVNHLEGHFYSNWLEKNRKDQPRFPVVALIVSGGHTTLIYAKDHLKFKIIGSTRDDAAGEAFDKGARLLDLPYPGGPNLSKLAKQGNPMAFNFPRPMKTSPDLDFSFSGLKTDLLRHTQTTKLTPKTKKDLAASYQEAIIDSLLIKAKKAVAQYQPFSFLLSGGVSANYLLRQQIRFQIPKIIPDIKIFLPNLKFCTDNAAMIAAAGYQHYRQKNFATLNLKADPNLQLS